MILKIRYTPCEDEKHNCWVYLDNIDKLETQRTTKEALTKTDLTGYYTSNKDCPTACQCESCKGKNERVVIASTYRNGKYESYAMDSDFFILSNDGKTVEKVVV